MSQNKHNDVLTKSHLPRRSRWLLGVAALLIIAAVFFYFRQPAMLNQGGEASQTSGKGKGDKPKAPPVSVAAATTRQGDMPIYLNGLGTVTALKTVTVRSRVDGELINVAFTEGQFVHKGDLLAEIDPRPFQVLFKQAQGQLIRDKALLENAKLDLTRYRTLLEQDSVAAQQHATQEALVKQYEGIVEMDQSQLDNANLQLAYAKITAPITGRIGLRLVDQGNIIRANDVNGMLVITQTQPIAVIFTLPEDVVPSVMKRFFTEHSLDVDAYDRAGNRKLASGKVYAVDNQIDTTTGTLKLKAQFENQEQTLFANQFVNIKMKLDTLRSATLAPTAAIQRGAEGSFVYVVKDDSSITVRSIKTGAVEGDTLVILEGLSPDEKLVVDGTDKLREGSLVRVVKLDNVPIEMTSPPDGQRPAGKHSKHE